MAIDTTPPLAIETVPPVGIEAIRSSGRRAEASAWSTVDGSGSARLFRHLIALRSTAADGVIHVLTADEQTSLHVHRGEVCYVESTSTAHRLGTLLVEQGALTSDDHFAVLRAMADRGSADMGFGETGVALGLLSPAQVHAALSSQVRERLISALASSEPFVEIERVPISRAIPRYPSGFLGCAPLAVQRMPGSFQRQVLDALQSWPVALAVEPETIVPDLAVRGRIARVIRSLARDRSMDDLRGEAPWSELAPVLITLALCGLIRHPQDAWSRPPGLRSGDSPLLSGVFDRPTADKMAAPTRVGDVALDSLVRRPVAVAGLRPEKDNPTEIDDYDSRLTIPSPAANTIRQAVSVTSHPPGALSPRRHDVEASTPSAGITAIATEDETPQHTDAEQAARLQLRARIRTRMGLLSQAVEDIEAACALTPNDPRLDLHLLFLHASAAEGKAERDALVSGLRVLALRLLRDDRRYALGHFVVGRCALWAQDYPAAVRAFGVAKRLAPADPDFASAYREARVRLVASLSPAPSQLEGERVAS